MKILTIGDIHGRNVWEYNIQKNIKRNDFVVFIGDYTDNISKSNDAIYNNLKRIIKLKKNNPHKVILIIGNHDYQYMNPISDAILSNGFNLALHAKYHELFSKNKKLFQLSFQIDNYLFTHAGVTRNWYTFAALPELYLLGISLKRTTLSEQLNLLCKVKSKCLNYIGLDKGGVHTSGSPLFASRANTEEDGLKNIHQIVGHTPVNKITSIKINNNTSVTYCDCLKKISNFYALKIDTV